MRAGSFKRLLGGTRMAHGALKSDRRSRAAGTTRYANQAGLRRVRAPNEGHAGRAQTRPLLSRKTPDDDTPAVRESEALNSGGRAWVHSAHVIHFICAGVKKRREGVFCAGDDDDANYHDRVSDVPEHKRAA